MSSESVASAPAWTSNFLCVHFPRAASCQGRRCLHGAVSASASTSIPLGTHGRWRGFPVPVNLVQSCQLCGRAPLRFMRPLSCPRALVLPLLLELGCTLSQRGAFALPCSRLFRWSRMVIGFFLRASKHSSRVQDRAYDCTVFSWLRLGPALVYLLSSRGCEGPWLSLDLERSSSGGSLAGNILKALELGDADASSQL